MRSLGATQQCLMEFAEGVLDTPGPYSLTLVCESDSKQGAVEIRGLAKGGTTFYLYGLSGEWLNTLRMALSNMGTETGSLDSPCHVTLTLDSDTFSQFWKDWMERTTPPHARGTFSPTLKPESEYGQESFPPNFGTSPSGLRREPTCQCQSCSPESDGSPLAASIADALSSLAFAEGFLGAVLSGGGRFDYSEIVEGLSDIIGAKADLYHSAIQSGIL